MTSKIWAWFLRVLWWLMRSSVLKSVFSAITIEFYRKYSVIIRCSIILAKLFNIAYVIRKFINRENWNLHREKILKKDPQKGLRTDFRYSRSQMFFKIGFLKKLCNIHSKAPLICRPEGWKRGFIKKRAQTGVLLWILWNF